MMGVGAKRVLGLYRSCAPRQQISGQDGPRMSGGEVMFHYTLSTCHTEKTPRSDVRLEMLAALRSTVEVAIGGKAVPLPGFPYYALSIRNTWTGAVGWLLEGAERRDCHRRCHPNGPRAQGNPLCLPGSRHRPRHCRRPPARWADLELPLAKHFASLDDFLKRWKAAERKQAIVEELEAEGLPLDLIALELGKDLDPFDLICHVAFDAKPLTRRERADNVKKRDVFNKYGDQARAVLDALLAKYADEGVFNLDDVTVLRIPPFTQLGTPVQLIEVFGGREGFVEAVHELQSALYRETA